MPVLHCLSPELWLVCVIFTLLLSPLWIENVAVDLNVGFHVSNNVKALVQKQQTKYHFPDGNINRFIINEFFFHNLQVYSICFIVFVFV